jgi:hemoglobin
LTAAWRKSNLWLPTELIWEGDFIRADLPGEGQMTEHDAPAPERPALYDRLGGVYNIATVVDDLIDRVMTDPRLNANPRVDEAHHRVSSAGFKYLVTEMVCWASGGPQRYSGRPMGDSHRHLMITAGEWQAFLDDFQQTLDKFGVPQPEQEELKAIVESTRDAIVVAPLQEGPAASEPR